jgi:hypothetical protein
MILKADFRSVAVLAAIPVALVVACGGEQQKEPTAATATASAPETPPPGPAETTAPKEPTAAAPAVDAGAGPKKGKEGECDALRDEANSTLDAARIGVDKVCKKDADCMAIKGRACTFDCANGAIPQGEQKGWDDAMAKVKGGACKKWTENECEKLRTKPPPKCEDKKVWCDKGHCALK